MPGSCVPMVNLFVSLYKNPQWFCMLPAFKRLDFTTLIKLCKTFHVLTPFQLPGDEVVVQTIVARLRMSHTQVELSPSNLRPFTRCSCGAYLEYAWCVHACMYAILNKSILSVPLLKDGIQLRDGTVLLSPVQTRKRGRGNQSTKDSTGLRGFFAVKGCPLGKK